MAVPAPVMYAEHATPTPRRFGPRRRAGGCQPRHLSRQPDASTTLSMHSPRPMVVTVRWLAVLVNGSAMIRRRISAGASPSCSAALSSWHSRGKRGRGVPWARLGPHGGLVGENRRPPDLLAGLLFV